MQIMTTLAANGLADRLIGCYGPTIGGRDLYAALGFKTYAAFHRSNVRNEIGVNVFKLPGRRDWFALTTEVAEWLEVLARKGARSSVDALTQLDDATQ